MAQVGANAQYFTEWASPDFGHPMAYLTAAMVGLTVLVRLRRDEPMPWGELAFLFLAAGATLYSYRTLPVAVAIVTPILAASLAPYVAPQPVRRWEKLTVVSTIAGCLLLLALLAPSSAAAARRCPAWMPEELEALPAHTVVLNDSEWGGYLMWAYPQLDLVTHGYGDTFTDAELQRNVDIFSLEPGWDRAGRGDRRHGGHRAPGEPAGLRPASSSSAGRSSSARTTTSLSCARRDRTAADLILEGLRR